MPLRPTRALIALLSLWTLMGLAGSLYPQGVRMVGVARWSLGAPCFVRRAYGFGFQITFGRKDPAWADGSWSRGGSEIEDHKFKQSPSLCWCV
jgi:hypothetical protein